MAAAGRAPRAEIPQREASFSEARSPRWYSGHFLNAAGMDTIRANESALNLPVKIGPNSLQIGTPRSLSLVIGVTDVVANRAAFAANRTNSGHIS